VRQPDQAVENFEGQNLLAPLHDLELVLTERLTAESRGWMRQYRTAVLAQNSKCPLLPVAGGFIGVRV